MRKLIAAAVAGIGLLAAAAPASAWPDRNVRFLVSLGPGSGVDITARVVGEALSKKWGQPVVIENRPGGDAIVAIAVPGSLGVNSVKELVAKIKAEPGKMNFAAATATNEFLFRGYLKDMGFNMSKVPYRDTVSAINDLGENRIQAYVGAYAIMRPLAQSGKVKILAVTNQERAKGAPEIPTVTEAGEPKLTFDGLVGIFGPTKMPKDLRDKIAADVKEVLAMPEVNDRLIATGQNVSPGTPDQFEAAMKKQIAEVAKVGKELDIKPGQN